MIDFLKDRHTWQYLAIGLVILAFAYWWGLIAGGGFKLLVFLIVSVAYVLAVMVHPEIGLLAIIVSAFSLEFLANQGWMPQEALWACDVLVVLLLTRMLFNNERTLGYFFHSLEFKILLIWFTLMIISSIANGTSMIDIFRGLRTYVRFILIYFCLIEYEWDEQFLAGCVRLITVLVLLQLPIVFIQKRAGYYFDDLGGTIGYKATGLMFLIVLGFLGGLWAYAAFNAPVMGVCDGAGAACFTGFRECADCHYRVPGGFCLHFYPAAGLFPETADIFDLPGCRAYWGVDR